MAESTDALTRQMLEWLAECPRTYTETMEAWRTSCPRLSIWEDALQSDLVQVTGDKVGLTEKGRALIGSGNPDPV